MTVSTSRTKRLPDVPSAMSTSRPFITAAGMTSQTICLSTPAGTSIGSGSGLEPGMSNGVPSWKMPLARRSANLFC